MYIISCLVGQSWYLNINHCLVVAVILVLEYHKFALRVLVNEFH